jgi:hypothetical protein
MTRLARVVAMVILSLGGALCPSWLLATGASAATSSAAATTLTVTATTTTADSTTIAEPDPGAFGALPRPNSGVKPQASGDRGGAAQLALLGIITAGLTVIGVVIARSTKRHTQSRSID